MPTYITLLNYTQKGIEAIEDSPDRADQAEELVESLGGELQAAYLTMGRYDLVIVTDFPDDDAAAKFLLRLGQTGTVSSETLRAWPGDDFRELVADMP
ncbi:MAG: GYD domain-containing protein [Halobacteriales archaeon]|nr:GYD domain-containing protein [Halobacteriales archaeon]